MATTFWIGNQRTTAQVDTVTIANAGAVGDTVSVIINTKVISYTTATGDTTSTIAAALFNQLNSPSAPPEFQELTYALSANVITCTAAVPGTPFTMTVSFTGAAAITVVVTTANQSPSDVNDPKNWLRGGSNSIPQNGDDVVVADSSVPLLWNLDQLALVQFLSYARWQSFTGTIGLPENNPLGYYEYRPTYFQFTAAGTLTMQLGVGQSGSGPGRERYNTGTTAVVLDVFAAGGALDDFSVRWKGVNVSNVVNITGGVSVGVAMLPAETATVATVIVDSGSVALGAGVTFAGTLTVNGGTAETLCAPGTTVALNGATVVVEGLGLTYNTVTARSGSRLLWLSNSGVGALILQTGAVFDKSQDVRAITVVNSTVDGDTCQVLDPYNAIIWTNATTVNNQVQNGPFTFGPGRTVKIT